MGWLWSLLLLLLLGVIALLLALLQKRFPDLFKESKNESKPSYAHLHYQRKRELLSAAERSFFGVLEQAVGSNYCIFGKVSLSDVIGPAKEMDRGESQTAQNKIQAKHVDFVLCDPKDFSLVCAIELDDKSHRRKNRRERDEFVDWAFESAGLKLLHFPCRSSYNVAEIRARVSGDESDVANPVLKP